MSLDPQALQAPRVVSLAQRVPLDPQDRRA